MRNVKNGKWAYSIPFDQLTWLLCELYVSVLEKSSVTSIPIHIARSELNTATWRPTLIVTTVRNVLREMVWLRAQYEHRKNVSTLHTLHKAVDGTEYIQFRSIERNSKITAYRLGWHCQQVHSTGYFLYSDPNKKNMHSTTLTLQQFSMCRPWPMCFIKDLFWRIDMYASQQDMMFTNKDRLKFHPRVQFTNIMFCQSRSQAVTVSLYTERLVGQEFGRPNWYS